MTLFIGGVIINAGNILFFILLSACALYDPMTHGIIMLFER